MTNILERYAEKVAMEEEQQEDVSLDKDPEDTTTTVQDDTPDAEDTDLVSTDDVSITEDDDAEDLDDTDTSEDDDTSEDTDDSEEDEDVEDTGVTDDSQDDDSYAGDDEEDDGYDAGDIDPDEDDDSGDLDDVDTDTSTDEDDDTDDSQDEDYDDTSEDTDDSEEDEDETEKKSDTVDEDDIATEEMNNILSSYFLSEEGFEEVITCFNSANAVATLEDNKEYIPKEVYTVSMEAIVTPIGLTYYSTEEDGENKGFFAKIFSAISKFFKGVGKKISEMFKWIGEKLTGKTKDTASRAEKYKEMVDANKAKLEAASGVINGVFGKLGSFLKGTGNYVMKGAELTIEGGEKLWDTELRKKVTDGVAELSKDAIEVVGDALSATADASKTVAVKATQTVSKQATKAGKKLKEKYREIRGLDERDINKAAAKLIEEMETDPEIAKGVFGDNRDGQAYVESLRRAGEAEYNKVKKPITRSFRLRDELLKKEREYRDLSNTDPQTDEIKDKLKDVNHEINVLKHDIHEEEKKYEEFTKKYNIPKNNDFFGMIKDTAISSADESNLEKVKDRIIDTIMISKLVHDLEPRYNKLTGRLSNKPSYQDWIATAGRTGKNRVTGNIVAELSVLQNQVVQWMENITRGREMLYDPKIVQFYMEYPGSILNFVSGDSEIDGLNRYAEQVSNSYEDCISKMVSVANVGWQKAATKDDGSVTTKLPAGYRGLDSKNAPSGSMIDERKQNEILQEISSAMNFPDVPKIGKLEYTPGPEIKSNGNGKIKGSLKTMSTIITSATSHKRFKITFLSGKLELQSGVGAEELSLVNGKVNSAFGEDPDSDQVKDAPVNSTLTVEGAMQYIFEKTSITPVRNLDNDAARFDEVGKWLGEKAAELRSRLSTLGKFETINSNIEAINKSIDSVLSKFNAETSRLGSESNSTKDDKKRLINKSMGRFKSLFTFFSTLMSKVLKNLVMILKAYTSDFNYYNKVLDQQIQAVGLIINASGTLSNKADEYEAKYQEADEYARSSGNANILPNKVDPRKYDDTDDTEE